MSYVQGDYSLQSLQIAQQALLAGTGFAPGAHAMCLSAYASL